eukprot:TRINITY_DN30416_c0_g1_i1.p1 TRINITY_DN30416_c0_g1~~TRINITY_DN30416_c0_g1_i1.p1  ORF type:complete len:174 (+),score=28.01 TRINITY_DN30416_c0_g1_i1:431-952(+)
MYKIGCSASRMKFCFVKRQKTFKPFETLEPNEKNYLGKFMNAEIAKLEEISCKTQLFIDEIDQIKRLSYSTIKKEDFTFEENGKLFKYWTLNKNMVPEGEDDSLEGHDCVFKTLQNEVVTMRFRVYSDLFSNWKVEVVSSEPFSQNLSFSLSVSERNCSVLSVPCLYFPEVEL